MGNSSSTNTFLTINESKTCIRAGSTISGEIRGGLRSSLVPVSNDLYSGVTLYFIGKEDVEVRYSESGHGTRGGGHKYKAAKRDIVRTIIPLDTSKQCVQDGRYPFEFRIPDQLPSSMYHKDGNGGHCSIRYKVKLHLMRGRDQEIPLEIVAKPPSATPIPSSSDPRTARIQFLYCIPQGSLTWAAGVDDTRVGVGEELTINLGIKNESLAKLERVSAKLKQTVEWQSSGHHAKNKSIVRSSSFSKTDSMEAWNKDQLRLKRHRSKGSTAAQPLTVYEEVLETVQEGNNKVTFPIPEYTCQSYSGRLIKIYHYVSITAKTPSSFTSPKIHIPIEVVSPRDTPAIVTAQVIPMPSAPFLSSDTDAPFLSNTFVVGSPVLNEEEKVEEEEIMFDSYAARKHSMSSTDEYVCHETCDTPPPASAPNLIEEEIVLDSVDTDEHVCDEKNDTSPPDFDPNLTEPFLPRDSS